MATNNVGVRGERSVLRRPAVRAPRISTTTAAIALASPRSSSAVARSRVSNEGRTRSILARFRPVLDAIQVAACIVDASGQILYANEIAAGLLSSRGAPRALGNARWDLTPLRVGAGSAGFLAICRSQRDEGRVGGAVPSAILRWGLTARQTRVLTLVARGLTNAAIAEQLAISLGTVEFHISAIFDKAGVHNRTTLVAKISDM